MKFKFIKSIGAALQIVLLTACQNTEKKEEAVSVALATDFIELRTGNATITQSYPGSIEGQDQVEIKPQVSGYLEKVYVKEGQYVPQGQPLFRIQSAIFEEEANQNEATFKMALAQQATVRLEMNRLKSLVAGKVFSDEQLKTAQIQLDEASARVTQAKAAWATSKINAGFTLIKAPVEGYISRIHYKVGNLVSPNSALSLTSLSNIKNVNVYFSMSEADFLTYNTASLSSHLTANNIELLLANGSKYTVKGHLEYASGNIDTGSIAMKAVFSNPNHTLRAGGTAKVLIHRSMEQVIQIPQTAVKDIQDKFFVFRLNKENKVKMIPVELSVGSFDTFLVKKGLSKGDRIAINRLDVLTDGTIVKPGLVSGK